MAPPTKRHADCARGTRRPGGADQRWFGCPGALKPGVIAYPRYWPAFASVLGILLLGVLASQIRPVAFWLLDLASRLPLIKRFSTSLREFYEGTYVLFRPKATVMAVSLGTVAWLGEGLAMYLVLLGLGISPGIQTAAIAIFVLSFSTVIGAVSALPGGLGAAEVSITGLLALLLQLPTSTATAATLIIRFGTLWFGVALGLAVWLISRDILFLERDPITPAASVDGFRPVP